MQLFVLYSPSIWISGASILLSLLLLQRGELRAYERCSPHGQAYRRDNRRRGGRESGGGAEAGSGGQEGWRHRIVHHRSGQDDQEEGHVRAGNEAHQTTRVRGEELPGARRMGRQETTEGHLPTYVHIIVVL